MLNAHSYISLLKCFPMTHTHHFGWASSCLFYMLLDHVVAASAWLTFLYKMCICSHALVVSFYWFWGSDDPILCTLYPIQIFLFVHKSWGTSLVSLEHSFAHIIISFIHVARRIFGLVGSIDILWLLTSIGIFWLLDWLCLSLLCLCGISFFSNLCASI